MQVAHTAAEPMEQCALCGRHVPRRLITQHHLTPRERGGKPEHRVPMCRPCHKQIHALFGNRQLAASYSDLASLRTAPELQPFIRFSRKQRPESHVQTRTSHIHPARIKRRRQRRRK